MSEKYDHNEIEPKWQQKWEEEKLYDTPEDPDPANAKYVLGMFPYPSGSGLHVGHVESFAGTDVYARFQRMQGKDVLFPMGWDAFGLPAENYAIKTGTHPRERTEEAIPVFKDQLQSLGFSYDWDREINTSQPGYYRWTQKLFTTLFEEGLAEKKPDTVNWCPSCQTVLANAQVVDDLCERCDTEVGEKEMDQWFFNTTEYADELVDDLDDLDWPESTKELQRNWIGRQEGARFEFEIASDEDGESLEVFTTRPDTLYGVTYFAIAPEHELVASLLENQESGITNPEEVSEYIKEASQKSDRQRQEAEDKTGVKLEGVTAKHPATGENLPVFVADYVLPDYGTGAIMAVPAHDERDFEFASKHDIPIKGVVVPESISGKAEKNFEEAEEIFPEIASGEKVFAKKGLVINSGEFSKLHSREAATKITKEFGQKETTYKLQDWSIGRQRYWGAPIPVVYDPEGNPHPVPDEHLPWELPDDVPFEPTGEPPLAKSEELKKRTEEIFGEGWTPETETMDTFVDSSWYFLRYPDPDNGEAFASKEELRTWCPVNMYIGGAEHAVLHLLYARFITKALADAEDLGFREPFSSLRHQGMVLAEDGTKMSKSKGNVVNPNEVVDQVGADTLRMYELFAGPFSESFDWDTDAIAGPRRFIERVWRLFYNHDPDISAVDSPPEDDVLMHQTVQSITQDIESFRFNTAISSLMEARNELVDRDTIASESLSVFLLLLAPFAPHVAEELWHQYGGSGFVHAQTWPDFSSESAEEDTVDIAIQIDGTVRGEMTVDKTTGEEVVVTQAKQIDNIEKRLKDKTITRHIYVPNKLVNFVTDA